MCKIGVHRTDIFTPFINQYQRHAYTTQSIAIKEEEKKMQKEE